MNLELSSSCTLKKPINLRVKIAGETKLPEYDNQNKRWKISSKCQNRKRREKGLFVL
jgi:hypothetical protein